MYIAEDLKLSKMWNKLIELGVSEESLHLATNLTGYSEDTLNNVLYITTGYRDFEQLEELER